MHLATFQWGHCEPALASKLRPYGFAPRGFYLSRTKRIGSEGIFNTSIDYVVCDGEGTHVATVRPSEKTDFEQALRGWFLEWNQGLSNGRPKSDYFLARYGGYFKETGLQNNFDFIAGTLEFDRYHVHSVPQTQSESIVFV